MIVCDVSAIDRLIDLYSESLSVFYNDKRFQLYDLRDEFVDNNKECSIENFTASSLGVSDQNGVLIISVDPQQSNMKDDLNYL
jgi:hypothetical protein